VQTGLFTAFAGLALVMAALGVYGLLSLVVTSRTRELGVRTAVGAQRRDLVSLIARDSAVWVACGLGGGLALAVIVSRSMSSLIYGSVVRRHGELAICLALGASHQRMFRLVLGEGALLIVIGMLLAIPGIYAAGGLIRGLLVDVSPWDPFTLAAVAFGPLFVTMAACYVPARRVLRIDPARLLRQN
jgi:ABC-type antimicrobial peptide transport system permease subunit